MTTNNGNYQQATNGSFDMFGNPITYGYNDAPVKKVKNFLTPEEIALLQKKSSQFTLNLTDEEVLRSQCNHRDVNGNLALADRPDGTKVCTICGEVFREADIDSDGVAALVEQVNDVIQTIKLMYYDMPAQAGREYYQIIALLRKLPKLLDISVDNFNKYDQLSGVQQNGANPFAAFQSFMTGGYPMYGGMAMSGMGMPQQPMNGYGNMNMGMAPQQVMPQQPMNGYANMNMGMQVPNAMNPFYGANGQPQYAPTTQGYAYDMNAAQQNAVAPAQAPQQQVATPQTGEVKVNAQVQA